MLDLFKLRGIVSITKCDIQGSWTKKWKLWSVNIGVGSPQDLIGLKLFVVAVSYGVLSISKLSLNILCSGRVSFTLYTKLLHKSVLKEYALNWIKQIISTSQIILISVQPFSSLSLDNNEPTTIVISNVGGASPLVLVVMYSHCTTQLWMDTKRTWVNMVAKVIWCMHLPY